MEENETGGPPERPDSLLPYGQWTEDALRTVVERALAYAASHGLPGEHHFYLSFRTDVPGVQIPSRLLALYPSEMTIVLQHQFWELSVTPGESFTVGLSFKGIPATLKIPFSALTGFSDPFAQFGARFTIQQSEQPTEAATEPAEVPESDEEEPSSEPQVVSLDAFRRKTPNKEG